MYASLLGSLHLGKADIAGRLLKYMTVAFSLGVLLAATSAQPIKLATTEVVYSGLSPQKGVVLMEYFIQQLTEQGFQITTERDVATLLGMERQRQLMGCSDSAACLIELAGALGADGLITGTLGKVGTHYTVTLRVMRANTGGVLVSTSAKVKTEDEVLEFLSRTARSMGERLRAELRPELQAASSPSSPLLPAWVAGGASVALFAGGGACLALSAQRADTLQTGIVPSQAEGDRLSQEGAALQTTGRVLLIAGGVAAATAGVLAWMNVPRGDVSVALTASPQGALVGLVGAWP